MIGSEKHSVVRGDIVGLLEGALNGNVLVGYERVDLGQLVAEAAFIQKDKRLAFHLMIEMHPQCIGLVHIV